MRLLSICLDRRHTSQSRSASAVLWRAFVVLAFALSANGQKFYTYVIDTGPHYVELAWGTVDGDNTIGRSSPSHGLATIEIAGRKIVSQLNYVTVGDLEPDHQYTYKVSLGTLTAGQGIVRTWPETASKLTFFVIGDFGSGAAPQYKIAARMWDEFQKHQNTDSPVRFILSMGDNIYGNIANAFGGIFGTGSKDSDWGPKFFQPYEPLIARIPFFPSIGNHDGNETEARGDLPTLLDNFAFPNDKPGRYYTFTFGGLAQFFALDSTRNTESGSPTPFYYEDGAQFRWMRQEFAKAHPPWVIPFYHHPVFNGGPLHAPSLRDLHHWVDLFGSSGVKVVFNGHEHNFQMSEANDLSHGIRFITSGAGGELRGGSIQKKMAKANIAAWAAQNHFLLVEIDGKTMNVTPLSFEPMHIVDSTGSPVPLPITMTLQ